MIEYSRLFATIALPAVSRRFEMIRKDSYWKIVE